MVSRGAQRRTAGNIAFLISLLAALLAAPYLFHPERSTTMGTIEAATGFLKGVPPIDRAAPRNIETATFSLG